MKINVVFFVGLITCLPLITGCNKTKSPYYIVNNDTIALLLNKNDSSLIAEIEYWKIDKENDSIINKLYDYYSINGYKTFIRPYKATPNDTMHTRDYTIMLDGKTDTIAWLMERTNLTKGYVYTNQNIKTENELRLIMKGFDLQQAKFYNQYYWDTNNMDYYAVCSYSTCKFYNKKFSNDTTRILNYFIDSFEYMRDSWEHLYKKEDILDCAIAIREIGEFAKICHSNKRTQELANNLRDSLNRYQGLYMIYLREAYSKALKKDIAGYNPEKVWIYEDSKELYLESEYFVSENNCFKIHRNHCHIWSFLGLKRVRFNWSAWEKFDHVYPVLPKNNIHSDDYIGWSKISGRKFDLYYAIKKMKKIYSPSLYFK